MSMAGGLPDRVRPSGGARPPVRWVHLGLGAFFRAFGCSYLADLGGWGVQGVSLRSASVRDRLAAQDFVYTAAELTADGMRPRQIEILRDVLVAPEDPQAVIDAIADPQVEIVSLTVTEKGYCHHPATRKLNLDHPDIRHDLEQPLPRSAIGFLLRGLAARRAAGIAPFTVLSCDNVPDNGRLVRNAVLSLANEVEPALADWIVQHARFPSTMVDRIVPATTADDIAEVSKLIGADDAAPVMHEHFRQWVIEDHFVGERPALDDVGAQFVCDVAPFEDMKLRMLNGAHSALAYLGYLTGHATVATAANDPIMAGYLRYLWRSEVIPTLMQPPDTDLSAYAETLLARFQNPAIHHATYQIAMDGSQKLPQRLLATISDRIGAGQTADGLLVAVAAWMRYVGGVDEAGNVFAVQDPMARQLRAAHADDPRETVNNLLGYREVFEADLAEQIAGPLVRIYADLLILGGRKMMERVSR